jgi:hypothetical protein
VASCLVATIYAFQANPTFSRMRSSALKVAVDPSTITNKEYEDICGVSFNDQSLHERLKSTKFLYPKHVEVVEAIGPLAGRMVDEIVSTNYGGFSHDVTALLFFTWGSCISSFCLIHRSLIYLRVAFGNRRESLATARFLARSFERRMGR